MLAISPLRPEPMLKAGSFLILEILALKTSYYPGPGIFSLKLLTVLVLEPITYLGPWSMLDGTLYKLGPGMLAFF